MLQDQFNHMEYEGMLKVYTQYRDNDIEVAKST